MVAQALNQANLSEYSMALIQTETKKTCTNLAYSVGESHDAMYRFLKDNEQEIAQARKRLLDFCKQIFRNRLVDIIIDDTNRAKIHSTAIEGAYETFDSSLGRAVMGLPIVTVMVTDGRHSIPVDCVPFLPKKIARGEHLTKSDIAQAILEHLRLVLNIRKVLADGHFSTLQLMSFLVENKLSFLMKFASNRVVTCSKENGQLRDILKFRKNYKSLHRQGFFNNLNLRFYRVKRGDKSIFFVSNSFFSRKRVENIYKGRWIIEVFHRTIKQSLGLSDCQSRSFNKQLLHALFVLEAYIFLELERVRRKLKNVEEVIKLIRSKNIQEAYA